LLTPAQVKMARAALGWSVRDLGERVGVAGNTVSRFENGTDSRSSTLRNIQRVFEDAGIEFISENGGGVGVRFREREEN